MPRQSRATTVGRKSALPPWSLKGLLVVSLAALYPFHQSLGGFNVSLGDLVVGLVFVGIIFGAAVGRLHVPRYTAPALVFLGVVVLAFFANVRDESVYFSIPGGTAESFKFAAAMSWMIAIYWLLRDDVWYRILLFAAATAILGCAFASWSIVQNVILSVGRIGRPTGPFENPNIYGNYLVLSIVLFAIALTLIREGGFAKGAGAGPRWWRFFYSVRLVMIPVLLLGLLATGSRGAMLAAFTALAVSTKLRLPRRLNIRRIAVGVVGLVIVAGAVIWFLNQGPHVLRRVEGATRGEGPNVVERLVLWDAAIKTFAARPVLGIGYGQFPYYSSAMFGLDPHVTHQTYLSVAAETGVVGLLILLWLLVAVIRDTFLAERRLRSRVPVLCRAFVFATCVQGLVANVDQFRSPWIVFAMVAALRLPLRRRDDVQPTVPPADPDDANPLPADQPLPAALQVHPRGGSPL